MALKIAINGFGRIGRLTMRNLLKKEGIQVVAINDLTDNQTLAHLFKYDTMQGKFQGEVSADDDYLYFNGQKILGSAIRNPAELPWKELGVDVVLECTGIFLDKEKAGLHLQAGAKRVVLSAPPKADDVPTFVIGANHQDMKPTDTIMSNASCTTNCLVPLVLVLDKAFGIEQFFMNTIHAYTSDQNIQDGPHRDLRRARAAAQNIVPTSTGAAKAVVLVAPHLKGKIAAHSLRVPVATGSLTDLVCTLKKGATVEEINAEFEKAAKGHLKGILEYCTDPIVSSDIVTNPHSSIFDAGLTQANGNTCRVVGWYDNEAGYSARLADLAEMAGNQG
ncbi:MAG: type I glyceraldehyde-3-phosphate dehydrogenase [Saprospiraceae bacterium]|nr:type I glyceraldehyde-3-phosphate dehydrogenase [Saprospiraceae bacterium]MCF8249926.1 type I glyceraldehyde-3-phosphate dehydrogenase [Saprospiraceae bacterium]MCF8279339.1 type I glyceraldehyde-3-phosphate dehydrogenase [Bacteroidales bacterium]MCF8310030.1 type I glyceraldehyde-3-phosphate dehydrogenase [Saprospiraceae bacterium]MCF8438930.1 type I glyceraldehyde-3-phosphate dehydrogenase [Saprospiraceae bacterium]